MDSLDGFDGPSTDTKSIAAQRLAEELLTVLNGRVRSVTREIKLSGYIMPSRPATSPESALTSPCSYDREPTFGNLRAGRSSGENCSTSYLKCSYSVV